MIKFGRRHNLIYAMMFVIFNFLRKIDFIIMKNYIDFQGSLLLTSVMFIADFISGLIIYIYNLKYLREKKTSKFMGIELITAPSNIIAPDSNIKMILLLFMASYVDFTEYVLSSYYIPKSYTDVSKSLEWRLKSIIICTSAFFSYFFLKFEIFKHQIITIIITLISLISVIITEIIVYTKEGEYESKYILKVLFLMLVDHIFNSSLDVIEKYLLEYDYMNPYQMLMFEGIFGIILSLLFSILHDPFNEFRDISNESTSKFNWLIVCIIFYFLLSGGRNVYRVATNKLYSPTHKALLDYILVPILIIYYYIGDDDFTIKKEEEDKSIFYYFFINLIISFIVVICGLIYNELIIIFFCGLEYDTHYEVSKRAKNIESHPFEVSINESEMSSFSMEENNE
jgi:hypothetical protein